MTKSQIKWAAQHDWFVRSALLPSNGESRERYKVVVNDDGIELNHYVFQDLKIWAGY